MNLIVSEREINNNSSIIVMTALLEYFDIMFSDVPNQDLFTQGAY